MKIVNLLEGIKNLEIVLPEFQREYVWKKKQAKELFNSLFNDYPTGSLLFWDTNTPPEIKRNAKAVKNVGIYKVILDGQQRLTTLFLICEDKIPPYYTEEDITNDPRDLHVNLHTGEFEFLNNKINGIFWIKVSTIFTQGINTVSLIQNSDIPDNEKFQILSIVNDNYMKIRNIKEKEYLYHTVPSTANIHKAIKIFDLINSQGTKLSNSDLALSHISGIWPQARNEFKNKNLNLKGSYEFSFGLDFYTRCLVITLSKSASLTDNKNLDYENLTKVQCTDAWTKIAKAIDHLLPLLKNEASIFSSEELTSDYLILPILTYIIFKNDFSETIKNGFFYWMYLAILFSRYSGQTNQTIESDINTVLTYEDPIPQLVKDINYIKGRLHISPTDLENISTSKNPFYKILYIISRINAIDLLTGNKLNLPLNKINNDIRIFSKEFLKDLEIYSNEKKLNEAYNDISNRVFILKEKNQDLSLFEDKPSEYLKAISEKFPNALTYQFIPTDSKLWEIENYEKFLKERRISIAKSINSYISKFHDKYKSKNASIDVKSIIIKGEDKFTEFKASIADIENKKSEFMEKKIIKSILSFLNTGGGNLLIGVEDSGNIVGINSLYKVQENIEKSRDMFKRELANLISSKIGKENHQFIEINILEVEDKDIAFVSIQKAKEAIIIKENSKEILYVRDSASSSIPLESTSDILDYIEKNWS